MKVKLTGIIEVQVEVETEIDDAELNNWWGSKMHPADARTAVPEFLRSGDEEAEIWATVTMTDIGNGEVLTAEFVEAEVLDV